MPQTIWFSNRNFWFSHVKGKYLKEFRHLKTVDVICTAPFIAISSTFYKFKYFSLFFGGAMQR